MRIYIKLLENNKGIKMSDEESNTTALKGVCCFFTETGTEGGFWAFQDERHISPDGQWSYDGLYILQDGDYLTVYSPNNRNEIVWEGIISLEPHPLFTEEVFGFWIHSSQRETDRETWARWFIKEYPAQLTPSQNAR